MKKILSLALALAFTTSFAVSQQTGDTNRDYTINGAGAGGTSPVLSTVGVPGQTLDNVYTTSDAGAPVVWIFATSSILNWVPGLSANSVDIGPTGLTFLLDGTQPGPLSALLVTNPTGGFDISLNPSAALAGMSYDLAFAHLSATSPDGLYVSQAHTVNFLSDPNLNPSSPACNAGATAVILGDDQSVAQALGFTFMYYGVGYSQCFVGSNGHITFGNGNSGWASGDLANSFDPVIATLSEDLNPSQGGTVSFFTDNTSTFEVCFDNVPEFFNTGANSFKTTCFNGAAILMDYGALSEQAGTVGLSPGSGTAPASQPLNLSVGGAVIAPNTAAWQDFDGFNSINDLAGFQIFWVLDAMGNPTAQN